MHYSAGLLALAALASAAEHRVDVGLGGLKFVPASVPAAVGDIIEFYYHPRNHNVIQSTFEAPCQPASNAFFSGFMPVAATSNEGDKVFKLTINDTNPIWFYCGQASHCQSGMVGVINEPTSGNTLAGYMAAAAKAGASQNPSTVMGGVVASNDDPPASISGSASSGASTATSAASSGASSAVSSGSTAATGAASSVASAAGSATSSAAAAATSKAGAVALQAVAWKELFALGLGIGGVAMLMQ